MRKELPITTNPWVRTYSYYALPLCIIMAEERIGKKVAEFEILDSDADDWTSVFMDKEGSKWYFKSGDQYNRDCNGYVYRPLRGNEGHIRVKIHFQQQSQPWAAVNLFLTDDKDNILRGDEQYLCRFGNFIYNGINLYFSGKKADIEHHFLGRQDELVLSVVGKRVEVFLGEKRLKKIGERMIDSNRQLYIGVQVKHDDNSFYPWLFSNYIHISSDVHCIHRRLEYYSFYKDEEYDLVSYFLDRNRYDAEELSQKGCVKRLKKEITKNRYIELKIDQYYLFGQEDFHMNHHLHQNLIYGFDDRRHVFFTIGYDNSGKIKKYRIQYGDLQNSLRRHPGVQVKVIKYRQGIYSYSFVPSYVKRAFENYLNGTNPESSLHSFLPNEERTQGIRIYEELRTDKGLDVLVQDRRISYLLYEHKWIMEKRISYMWNIGILGDDIIDDLKNKSQFLVNLSYNLMNLAQKYRIRPSRRNNEKLKQLLNEIEENERELLECLVKKGDWSVEPANKE